MATRPQPSIGREQARDMDCENYRDCMGVAARERWDGFDCSKCPQMGTPTILRLSRGPESRRARPLAEPAGKPSLDKDPDAMSVLAALVKAEHSHGSPVSSRHVGAYLGIGSAGARIMLAELEGRGLVKRHHTPSAQAGGRSEWSLK